MVDKDQKVVIAKIWRHLVKADHVKDMVVALIRTLPDHPRLLQQVIVRRTAEAATETKHIKLSATMR